MVKIKLFTSLVYVEKTMKNRVLPHFLEKARKILRKWLLDGRISQGEAGLLS